MESDKATNNASTMSGAAEAAVVQASMAWADEGAGADGRVLSVSAMAFCAPARCPFFRSFISMQK